MLTHSPWTPSLVADALTAAWMVRRPLCTRETDLQESIRVALLAAGIPMFREFHLTLRDRPDFLVDGCIALEVKVKGGLSPLTRQVFRYAEAPIVSGVLVVTSRNLHRRLPDEVLGKPCTVLCCADWLL